MIALRRTRGSEAGAVRPSSALLLCRSGVVALEFALLGPLSMLTVILGIAFVRLYIIDACMHDALIEAARYGATGNDAASGLRPANIQTMMNTLSHVSPTMTITPYASWANLNSNPPVPNAADLSGSFGAPGQAGEVVVYTASYVDPLLTNMMNLIPLLQSPHSPGSGTLGTLTETTVIQNEPNFSTQ